MSDTIASYSFLPWIRQGLSNSITQADHAHSVKLRASINVRLTVSSVNVDGSAGTDEPVQQIVQLYGPGDIIGIDSKAIIKTDPHNWITNFEPNYLPYIDFYHEDFPWRYTPARPNGETLRPWLTLVVLKEDEFENGKNAKNKPLPFFKIKDGKRAVDIFPNESELWAWAHIHVNKDLSNEAAPNTADAATINAAITDLISQSPDNAYSRIMSPRKLEPNIGYHAFLIPSFESGRLAGLGLELPADLAATACGWDNESNSEFPYYHRWYFRTGNVGDFEYLVNLLKPKPADKSVGVRDMDVLHPGSNLPKIDNPTLKGILKLGGALRVPFDTMKEADKEEMRKYDQWDEPPNLPAFPDEMAVRINLADDYVDVNSSVEEVNLGAHIFSETHPSDGDPDPVITSPLYGRWHAIQERLLIDRDGNNFPHNKNWVHELNLDPRFRVAAGLGTKVLQKNQEEYMHAAWQQVGRIVEANNRIRFAQLAKEVSAVWHSKHIKELPVEKAFIITAPLQKRVIHEALTVHKQVKDSVVSPTLVTGTFRSIVRPRGATMKKLLPRTAGAVEPTINVNNLVQRINEGKVIIAPPKVDPEGAINLSKITAMLEPTGIPPFIKDQLEKNNWLKYLPIGILVILALVVLFFFMGVTGLAILGIAAGGLGWAYGKLNQWDKEIKLAAAINQENQVPAAVDSYPASSNFVISEPGSGFRASYGGNDSQEASNYKIALKDAFHLVNIKFPAPVRLKLDLAAITRKMQEKINPHITIPRRTFDSIKVPDRFKGNMVEQFAPILAYPEFDLPMYQPLAGMSSELFLPNINLIEQNSITLLENNQKFIESYMVGINHEMSRELLWREYPTDLRGTCFRQFWEVNSFLDTQEVTLENLKSRFRTVLDKRNISRLRDYYNKMLSTPTTLDERFFDEATDIIRREELKDIYPINFWSKINEDRLNPSDPDSIKKNDLGAHNQRAEASGKTQLVLVIRGELLKKYPTAVIYAQKADWGTKPDTTIKDVKQERVLVEITADPPPTSLLKTPLFEAKVDPDIYFFGFDLDDEEAKGHDVKTAITSDDPGWFFVIKERPGEPRFGLDIEKARNEEGEERRINWNNLSWPDLETADGTCIQLNKTITLQNYVASKDQENVAIDDDVQAQWKPNTSASELAYILYQVPVLVAVHASRMLPK